MAENPINGNNTPIYAGSISADRISYNDAVGFYDPQLVTKPNRLTNADSIRACTDAELANVLSWLSDKRTADGWLDWLKSPVEVDHANPD